MVYETTRAFPSEERFGLIPQMRRAAVSISSNIAEGTARITKREQARFSEIAYASATELLAQCILALDLGFINMADYEQLREKIQEVTVMVNALRKSQADELHEPDVPYYPLNDQAD